MAGPTAVSSTALLFPDVGLVGAILRHSAFRRTPPDHAAMERALAESTLEWTVARPPRLTLGPRTGTYRAADGALPRPRPWLATISRADVADLPLREVEKAAHVRKVVGLVS